MQKSMFILIGLVVVTMESCSTSRSSLMSGGKFTLERLELVDRENTIVVTDPEALRAIKSLFDNSREMSQQSNTVDFVESKKLRLVRSDPNEMRVYSIDLQNGYVHTVSMAAMPVYRIGDIEEFKTILRDFGEQDSNVAR